MTGMGTRGFLVSAANKSSGKTTVTLGLCAVMHQRGLAVQSFKKGPDYIDPMWLGRAAGRPCINLDFHTQTPDEIAAAFQARALEADVAVIEGNKGLFDGVDPDGGNCTAALAGQLKLPVVLIIDSYGITRGIAPLLLGYQAFAGDVAIAGVVLNKVGGARHLTKLRQAVESYTDLPVLGAVDRRPEIEISERHLGLIPTNEAAGADALVAGIARLIESSVDVERLLQLAAPIAAAPAQASLRKSSGAPVRIGIARDAAFGFYYPDDAAALETCGAELVPFDCLKDKHLPSVDGLFIGGGFPENHLDALSDNMTLRGEIRAAIEGGLPAYAECGGLLYLARSLEMGEKRRHMVGVIPADGVMNERPVGRGYMRLSETGAGFWPEASTPALKEFPAHEFHYASLKGDLSELPFAYDVVRGFGLDGRRDGLMIHNLLACFAHQRDTAANRWAERFVGFARRVKSDAIAVRPAAPETALTG